MTIYTGEVKVKTNGEPDIIDVTEQVTLHLKKSSIQSGLVTVFCTGSTAAVTTIEYEPGLLKDLPVAMERFAPRDALYEHQLRWQDGNGHSHVRAAIIGPSITIPIIEGKMPLGTWQQIVLLELDVKPRTRQLVIQVIGDQ
ncbi:MAG: secondary thiamine-phosphate synthase enzyme YjbQ [Promethearchaeota archaeon]